VSRCWHRSLRSSLIDIVIVRWRRASSLTSIVVCQHCSSTLSVIALADWRHLISLTSLARFPVSHTVFLLLYHVRLYATRTAPYTPTWQLLRQVLPWRLGLLVTLCLGLMPPPWHSLVWTMELRELEAVSTLSTLSQLYTRDPTGHFNNAWIVCGFGSHVSYWGQPRSCQLDQVWGYPAHGFIVGQG